VQLILKFSQFPDFEARMNQKDEIEQQLEQLEDKQSSSRENKKQQQVIAELRRELQQLHAQFKMGINENEQLQEEMQLMDQRVNLEISMQQQLKNQMQEMRERLSQ
jgi:hypothetical protein